jgi:hypothetical protein
MAVALNLVSVGVVGGVVDATDPPLPPPQPANDNAAATLTTNKLFLNIQALLDEKN